MDPVDMVAEGALKVQDARDGDLVTESPASHHEPELSSHRESNDKTQSHPQPHTGSASPPVRQNTLSSVSTMATMASSASTLQTMDSPSTPTHDGQLHLGGQLTFSAGTADHMSKKKGARRRTGPLTEEQRHRAAMMRKIGACKNCKAKRVGCNPSHKNMTWDQVSDIYYQDKRRSNSPQSLGHFRPREQRGQTVSPPLSNGGLDSEMDIDGGTPMHHPSLRRHLSAGGEARLNRTPLPSGPRLDVRTSPGTVTMDSPLQAIASRILADPGRSRYREVDVLMLYWEHDDDFNVKICVQDLAKTLQEGYHYKLQIKTIPSESGTKSSWTWLSSALVEFMQQNDQRDVLKIVYYNGHTYLDANGEMMLASSKSQDAQAARWSGLQQILEEACMDTLLLIDAAYYPLSALTRKQGIFELIAAASGADHANQLGRNTFTRALTDLLSRKMGQQPGSFTAADLHAQLLSVAYPRALKGSIQDRAQEQQLMASFPAPVHLQLSGNARLPSVSLIPVHIPGTPNGTTPNGTALQNAASAASAASMQEIILRFTADPINQDAWSEWLRQMPAGIKAIEVAGPYRLGSPKA